MTEESKQIVERLRKEQEGASRDPYGPVDADLYGEAADHIEKLEGALDAAERRGFERCREMALAAIESAWKGCPYETEGCHDVDAEAIRAIEYKEGQ